LGVATEARSDAAPTAAAAQDRTGEAQMTFNQRGPRGTPVSHNSGRTYAPDGRGATSPAPRRKPVGKDPLAVETANDILEESQADHYYVFRGDPGANAARVIYIDNDWLFEEPTIEQSLARAKLAVRLYRIAHGLDNPFAPDGRWTTIAPVKVWANKSSAGTRPSFVVCHGTSLAGHARTGTSASVASAMVPASNARERQRALKCKRPLTRWTG
jgi:hypothetical protein